MNRDDLKYSVAALMEQNRRETSGHHYTLPSPELYPFQWFWDSCFHAIILLHCDEPERAKQELLSALARPLPNGLIPHIIYWELPEAARLWGREQRGDIITEAWAVEGSSSITQPPIIADTVLRVYEADPNEDFLLEIYPVLESFYTYLCTDRRFNGDALAYIINPDESGEDNSPRFDRALDLPSHHSAHTHLDKRVELMRENATCNFEAHTCMSQHFGIADTPFNILFMEGLAAMSKLATILDRPVSAKFFARESNAVKHDIMEFLRHGDIFAAYDFINKEYITTKTWAMFMPLYAGLLSQEEAQTLVDDYLLNEEHFKTPYMIPSTARSEPAFDAEDGFWRGPVWILPNWFVHKGLSRYGFTDAAGLLKEQTLALLERSGFREQYHPETGEGMGAKDFTWGGLVLDME